MKKHTSKLSVIGVVRNDNYGKYLNERLLCFFRSIQQCKQPIELILVEWNPPKDAPSFYAQYKHILPTNKKIKIITVPAEIHQQYDTAKFFPVYEYIGKNVGLRHVDTEYTLFTNPDNIFLPDVWPHIIDALSPNNYLRIHRMSLSFALLQFKTMPLETIVKKLKLRKLNKWYDELTYDDIIHGRFKSDGPVYMRASGDFICANTALLYNMRGFEELTTYSSIDGRMLRRLLAAGVLQTVLPGFIYHIEHARPHFKFSKENNLHTGLARPVEEPPINWGLADSKLSVKTITPA